MLHEACGIMRVSVVPVKLMLLTGTRHSEGVRSLVWHDKQHRNFSWRWRSPRNGAARKSSWTLGGARVAPFVCSRHQRHQDHRVSENVTNEGFPEKRETRSRKSRQQHKRQCPNVPTVKRSWQIFMRRKKEGVAVGQVFNFPPKMFKDFAYATWQCPRKRRVCELYTLLVRTWLKTEAALGELLENSSSPFAQRRQRRIHSNIHFHQTQHIFHKTRQIPLLPHGPQGEHSQAPLPHAGPFSRLVLHSPLAGYEPNNTLQNISAEDTLANPTSRRTSFLFHMRFRCRSHDDPVFGWV